MGKNVTVTCDNCNADLTYTYNCIDYRLALMNQHMPSKGGAVTAMLIHPIIDKDAYFCGIKCMKKWIENK